MTDSISAAVLADLAPTGKLRVGINYGNLVLATRDPNSGDLRGVAVDLARELGKRVNVPVELVAFDSAGKMFDAVKAGAWDAAFFDECRLRYLASYFATRWREQARRRANRLVPNVG